MSYVDIPRDFPLRQGDRVLIEAEVVVSSAPHDAFAYLTLKDAGSVMVRRGDITRATHFCFEPGDGVRSEDGEALGHLVAATDRWVIAQANDDATPRVFHRLCVVPVRAQEDQ